MERFDADYRKQLHFNFSATRTTQKHKQAFDATRASRLRDIDLDALTDNTSATINSSKRQDLSQYILEDILDCPVGSRFIVCIAMEDNDDERSKYYSETAAGQRQQWKRLSHLLWQRRQWQLWQPHTTYKLQPDAVALAVAWAAVAERCRWGSCSGSGRRQ
jgi:hypothetical protein